MTTRDPVLQAFLSSVRDALAARVLTLDETNTVDRIFEALVNVERSGSGQSCRLPVCAEFLPEACAHARRHSSAMAHIVDSFEAIEPRLFWAPRSASGPHASANWPQGHANAVIVGPGGLETRSDVQIGASLLAPYVRYPDHNHAPEEVYLVLSPGRFRHGETGWFEPGIGGTLYNEPNVLHAMASDEAPLLALWFLWVKRSAG
jgi:hypothetical protein